MKLSNLRSKCRTAVKQAPVSIKYIIVATLFLSIGLLVGYVAFSDTSELAGSQSKQNADQAQRIPYKQQISNQYTRLQERIKTDVNAQKLDQETANKIMDKNEQIKRDVESIDKTTDESKELLRIKRTEIRDWARENQVSRTYLIRV